MAHKIRLLELKPGPLREGSQRRGKYIKEAEAGRFMGMPLTDATREDLLVIIAHLNKQIRRYIAEDASWVD